MVELAEAQLVDELAAAASAVVSAAVWVVEALEVEVWAADSVEALEEVWAVDAAASVVD